MNYTYFRKTCQFCRKKITYVDYKNPQVLYRFLTPWNKIRSTQNTGTCAKHQRKLAVAIKRARFLAMLPYLTR